jgi:hypothetical protein
MNSIRKRTPLKMEKAHSLIEITYANVMMKKKADDDQ